MDVSIVNRILNSFNNIMQQIGFMNIKTGEITIRDRTITSKGVMIIIGIIGDMQGNIIYSMTEEDAKKIASVMMMGMKVEQFDAMAQSAISELINMLSANAATSLSDRGIVSDISTPTLIYGEFTANANKEKIINVNMELDGSIIEVDISLDVIKENY